MQNRLLGIFVAVGLILLALIYYRTTQMTPVSTPPPGSELPGIARQAVVSVWSSLDGTLINQGSGFIVSGNGLIITNRHVVAEGDSLVVRFDGDVSADEFIADVIESDIDNDLALLKITAVHLPTLPLAPGKAAQGHRVWALGFPSSRGSDAGRMTVTSGIVSRINPDQQGVPLIVQTDAYLTNGSSGGPLYDLDAGGVIGVCGWSQHDDNDRPMPGINYAISIEKVIELFGKYM